MHRESFENGKKRKIIGRPSLQSEGGLAGIRRGIFSFAHAEPELGDGIVNRAVFRPSKGTFGRGGEIDLERLPLAAGLVVQLILMEFAWSSLPAGP